MPLYVVVIANLVLCALVVGAIVGLLSWSVLTQHRDPHCRDVRLRRRGLRITVRLVSSSARGWPEPSGR